MKYLVLTCTILSTLFSFYSKAQGSWIRKANAPNQICYAQSLAHMPIGNRGYFGIGPSNCWWEYDPVADKWTKKADYPGKGKNCYGTSANGKGYIAPGISFNGSGSIQHKDFWEYTPATDQWNKKADFPGLGDERLICFSIGGKVYVGGGSNHTTGTLIKDFWEYNPQTNQWKAIAPIPEGRGAAMTFVIGNLAYVGAGEGNNGPLNTFYRYSPQNNTWTQIANFPNKDLLGQAFSVGYKG